MAVKHGISHQGRNTDCWRSGEERKMEDVAEIRRKLTATIGSFVEFYWSPKHLWMIHQGGSNRLGM